MRIGIVTPAPPGSSYGNRITAIRWAGILRKLGHRVTISQVYEGEPYDLLIALHARRSYPSISRYHRENTGAPLIVALTGTDLYRDIRKNLRAQKSLELAARIVVLQPKALEELRPDFRDKTRVIYQSFEGISRPADARQRTPDITGRAQSSSPPRQRFDVCVIGHLRAVKDPFRTALAARLLPASSSIRVLHVGGAMTAAMAKRARAEMLTNLRYRWLDEQPRWRVRRLLAKSRLCVLSSIMEGGANVLSEAIVASVPVLASHIDGAVGILGANYPGYFNVGDTHQLARLLARAETDPAFLAELKAWEEKLAPLFNPAREERAWTDLISELQIAGH